MYRGRPLDHWLGRHPAFSEGYKVESNLFYLEMQAMETFTRDPDVYLAKGRTMRKAMVGYVIGRNALKTMQEYDMAKKYEAEAKKGRKGR